MVVAVLARVLGVTSVSRGVEEEQVPVTGVVVIVVAVAGLASKKGTVGWLVTSVVPVVGVTVSTQVVVLVSNGIFCFIFRLVFESHRGWACHGSPRWSGRLCR